MTQPNSRPQLVMSQRIGRANNAHRTEYEQSDPPLSRLRGGGLHGEDAVDEESYGDDHSGGFSRYDQYTATDFHPPMDGGYDSSLENNSNGTTIPQAFENLISKKFLVPAFAALGLVVGLSVFLSNGTNDRSDVNGLGNLKMSNPLDDDAFAFNDDNTNSPTPFNPFGTREVFSNVVPVPTQLAVSHNVPKIAGETENLITVRTTTFHQKTGEPPSGEGSSINIRYKFPAGTPTTAPWFESQTRNKEGSPVNVLWKYPAGTPTTAPWGQFQKDREQEILNGGLDSNSENAPKSSPTNIVWKFPAGTPTTAPWKNFVSESSPTNLRWKVPHGTPTTAPWKERNEKTPTTLLWKFPAGTPTTAPWKALMENTSPSNMREAYPAGTPTTAPWKQLGEESREGWLYKGEKNRHVELGMGRDDDEPGPEEHTYIPTASPVIPLLQEDVEEEEPVVESAEEAPLTPEQQAALIAAGEQYQELSENTDVELISYDDDLALQDDESAVEEGSVSYNVDVDEPPEETLEESIELSGEEEEELEIDEETVQMEEEDVDAPITLDQDSITVERGEEKHRTVELPEIDDEELIADAPEEIEVIVEDADEIPDMESTSTTTNTDTTTTTENVVKVINNKIIERVIVQGDAAPQPRPQVVNHHYNQGVQRPVQNVVQGVNYNPNPNWNSWNAWNNRYVVPNWGTTTTNVVNANAWGTGVWAPANAVNPGPQVITAADSMPIHVNNQFVQNGGAHYATNGERIHYYLIDGRWIPHVASGDPDHPYVAYRGPILTSPPEMVTESQVTDVEIEEPEPQSFSNILYATENGLGEEEIAADIMQDCDTTVDNDYLDDYRAPSGEDEAIYEIYYTNPLKTCGTIVEIGAKTGDQLSKSWFFEKALHWKPILIEAHPVDYAELENNRPDAVKINAGFCEGTEMTYMGDGHFQGSGFHREVISEFYSDTQMTASSLSLDQQTSDNAFLNKNVPCIGMGDVLATNSISKIDIMYISTPGDALAVIRKMDWTVRVDIWVIELSGVHEDRDEVVRRVLRNNDYVKAEWDIKRWCNPVMMGHCMPNEVWLRKGFNPLPSEDISRRLMVTERRRLRAASISEDTPKRMLRH